MNPSLRLSRIHYPVDVLGPGRRVGIWLQGCTLACSGCLSRDTWDPGAGTATTVDDVVAVVLELTDGHVVDGVTVSGGEPFQQPDALMTLLARLRSALDARGSIRPVDILVYSGFALDVLRVDHSEVLAQIDALIPEPYAISNPSPGRWRGSGNQPLVLLSGLGAQRYTSEDADELGAGIQVVVDDESVWMIGIPRRGDLPRMERLLAERGIRMSQSSWRP